MFDLPDAKRVRRSDLHSPTFSRSSSPPLAALEHFKAQALDYIVADPAPVQPVAPENEADEVTFNLFSRPRGTDAPRTVIQLRSPSPVAGEGGVLGPGRPESFYFTGTLSEGLAWEYGAAALSGEEVRRLARTVRPGSGLEWKLTTISAKQEKVAADDKERSGRSRPGKKTRIKRRQVAVAVAEKASKENATKAEKERLDREKRAKRNREKKFKKRARDKAKKEVLGTDGQPDQASISLSGNEAET